MPMNRTLYADLFFQRFPYMYRILMETLAEFPELFSRIFTVVPTTRPQEQLTGVTGLGFMQEIDEGEVFPSDRMLAGFSKTFRMKQFALLVKITKLAIDDDADNVFNTVPRAIARSYRATREQDLFNIINNGLSNVDIEKTPDGLSIFNASHKYVDPLAGTFSNYAAADLTEDTLETALTTFFDQTDDRGKPVVVDAATLWVASGGTWTASRVLDSPQSTNPPTGFNTNAINAISKVMPNLFYDWSPFITDADSWFVFGNKESHEGYAFMRQELEADRAVDFDTKTAKLSGDSRWRGGFGAAHATYGSSGA